MFATLCMDLNSFSLDECTDNILETIKINKLSIKKCYYDTFYYDKDMVS